MSDPIILFLTFTFKLYIFSGTYIESTAIQCIIIEIGCSWWIDTPSGASWHWIQQHSMSGNRCNLPAKNCHGKNYQIHLHVHCIQNYFVQLQCKWNGCSTRLGTLTVNDVHSNATVFIYEESDCHQLNDLTLRIRITSNGKRYYRL